MPKTPVWKIAVADINQETCSFNPVKTTLRDFQTTYFKEGPAVVDVPPHDGVIGGFAAAVKPENYQLEGIIAAKAMSGGALTAETFADLKNRLLTGLKHAGKPDAVFLVLHGAMAAENEPDTEGVILPEVRKLVGPGCFIGVALDHHANVTRKMVEAADVMTGYETQPHELPGAGAKTARVMLDIWQKNRTPHAALVKVPMLAPQDNFLTSAGPMKEWFDLARAMEKDPAVMAASTFPTQPWLDAPERGWSCLVYADSAEKAQSCAEKLAQKAWDLRERFWQSNRLPLPELIAAANAEPKGVVSISDTGDSTLAGGPGDNTSILAEILKHDLRGPALVPVVDPEALEEALKAGTGREITLPVGGKMSAGFSPRLKITGLVKAAAEAGELTLEDGRIALSGRSVLLECGQVKLVITEFRDYAMSHPSLYQKLGVDVGKAQMVVIKTGSNFQYFKRYQSRLLRADSPGATQSNLEAFPWKNINRPLYPFDDLKDWRA